MRPVDSAVMMPAYFFSSSLTRSFFAALDPSPSTEDIVASAAAAPPGAGEVPSKAALAASPKAIPATFAPPPAKHAKQRSRPVQQPRKHN